MKPPLRKLLLQSIKARIERIERKRVAQIERLRLESAMEEIGENVRESRKKLSGRLAR